MDDKNLNTDRFEQTVYVDGMHCASCEVLIEKKLLKLDGIDAADASLARGGGRIVKKFAEKITPAHLNQIFLGLGYRFSNAPIRRDYQPLIGRNSAGSLTFNTRRLKQISRSLLLALGLLFAFFIAENFQFGRFVSINDASSLGAFFFLGLVAGISSCAALIGGVLLSLTKHWHEQYIDVTSTSKRATPHALFHVGRLVSFFFLGGILGLVGDAITFNSTSLYVTLVMIISVLMLLVGLQLLNVCWAARLMPRLPKFITRAAARDGRGQSNLMPLSAGALTFFLPCGFTLIAQGVALASGNFLYGSLIMLYFAFGTLPTLLVISISGLKFTSKPHLTAKFSTVAGILILFFSFYNMNGQLNVLGLPSLSDMAFAAKTPDMATLSAPTTLDDSIQLISIVARDFNYLPAGPTTITAGVPTKLVVDDQGAVGCSTFLSARGLFDGFVALKRGQNIIDLGTPKAGTYKITCSMGMVSPVVIKV